MRALLAVLLVLLAFVPLPARAGAVAVLYFENQGNPELEPLKVGLAQMLVTDLKSNPQLQVVERARLQEILDELDLGHSGKIDPTTAAQVGKLVGAEWLLMGSYFEVMGTLRIDARLVNVETGEIVHAHGLNGTPKEFIQMEKGLAGSFTAALLTAEGAALPRTSTTQAVAVSDAVSDQESIPAKRDRSTGKGSDRPKPGAAPKASAKAPAADAPPPSAPPAPPPPPAPEPEGGSAEATTVVVADEASLGAAIAFSEGLIHLDQKDLPRAREAFERAVTADPRLDIARAELERLKL